MKQDTLRLLVEKYGQKYSETLGIDLSSRKDEEIFKWFLAAMLFGAPITEKAVIKTYICFKKHGILTPKRILETGWNKLVEILDEGSYTRYDFKTADKLLEVMCKLTEEYKGSLTVLYDNAVDGKDLERRIKGLGKGIGDVTVSIFLRELREIWEKADPNVTDLEVLAAEKLGIVKEDARQSALKQLKELWFKNKIEGKSFVDFETSLLRLGKDFCRKIKCIECIARDECLGRRVP
jgi:endonuclease III